MIESAYELLRVSREAGPEEVRQAYVRLVRRYPPEHFPEKFASIRRAYQQLTLDDDFIQEVFSSARGGYSTPLELAGFLWGDRKELRPERESPLTDLIPLLKGEEIKLALSQLLEDAASQKIEWKTS
ncbi:MAG: DnaJ domain-containing protein [Synergistaceae bacterium]|jgi:hypothetical protein|nr:DnaJ domain-containing protein [Synergistaceae bacterium]